MFKAGDKLIRLDKNPVHQYYLDYNNMEETLIRPGDLVIVKKVTPSNNMGSSDGFKESEGSYLFEEELHNNTPHYCLVEENFALHFTTWKDRYQK